MGHELVRIGRYEVSGKRVTVSNVKQSRKGRRWAGDCHFGVDRIGIAGSRTGGDDSQTLRKMGSTMMKTDATHDFKDDCAFGLVESNLQTTCERLRKNREKYRRRRVV